MRWGAFIVKRKFCSIATVSMLIILQAVAFGRVFYEDVRIADKNAVIAMDSEKEELWDSIKLVLDNEYTEASYQGDIIKSDIKKELNTSYIDKDMLAYDLQNPKPTTKANKAFDKVAAKYSNKVDMMVLVSLGQGSTESLKYNWYISNDRDLSRSSNEGTIRDFNLEISRHYNETVAKEAFTAITTQSGDYIFWQPEKSAYTINSMKLSEVERVFTIGGVEALKGIDFVYVDYIENSSDLMGVPDTLMGQRTNNNKIAVLQVIPLYDVLNANHKDMLVSYDKEIQKIQERTDNLITSKLTMLFLLMIITAIVLSASISLQNMMANYTKG